MYDKRIKWIYDIMDFLLSVFRVFTLTRFRPTHKAEKRHDQCIIMGNGPSLRSSLEENADRLHDYDLIAVNNFAMTDDYVRYKPPVYVLCDNGYWLEGVSDSLKSRIIDFYRQLSDKTDWSLQLYIPYAAKKTIMKNGFLSKNSHIRLHYYNKTKVEGFKKFRYSMINRQWGVFRVQNVVVAALLLSIYSDYKQIFLFGTENDWVKNIRVDGQNRLRINDTHFYGREDLTLPYSMEKVYIALYYTFRSYQDVAKYAEYKSVRVFNATPSSFIDAFERKNLP